MARWAPKPRRDREGVLHDAQSLRINRDFQPRVGYANELIATSH